MPFQFKKSGCVVLGTFNTYIVQPLWLAKIGIIERGPVEIGTKIDEPGLMFSPPPGRQRWVVTPARIDIHSEDPKENCGEAIASVLAKLPWTPLVAIGNNAHYGADLSELSALPALKACPPEEAPEGYRLQRRSLFVALGQERIRLNFQLSITEEAVEIATNVHADLREHENASEFAQDFARKYFEHRKQCENLILDLWNVRIEHDPHA